MHILTKGPQKEISCHLRFLWCLFEPTGVNDLNPSVLSNLCDKAWTKPFHSAHFFLAHTEQGACTSWWVTQVYLWVQQSAQHSRNVCHRMVLANTVMSAPQRLQGINKISVVCSKPTAANYTASKNLTLLQSGWWRSPKSVYCHFCDSTQGIMLI